MGAGNDTATFTGTGNDTIKGGDGNDTITAAAGTDSIDGGAGDDLMIMAVGDLESSDTITGGVGTDTVRILDGENITDSEALNVTEVEIFDLEGAGTTLTIIDNLIKTATDKSFTVDTETSTGTHTIDMTNITSPEYKFTLKGSETNNEVVIANDETVNGMSTLTFGASTADTLKIVDGATITASDLVNVSGLDIMYLEASSNTAQTWNIDLAQAMVITVSPTVPAGSVLNISSSVAGVTVNYNANITVNITGTAANVTATTEYLFTDNADNMTGTAGDDVFIADRRDQIETADFANASTEAAGDELKLNFGIFNSGESLDEQLNKADISEMEIITFKQGLSATSGVRFNDVDGTTGSMEADLNVINLTDLADTVTVNDANGVTVNGLGGNDSLTTTAASTLNGGDGDDTLTGSAANDTLSGGNGNDTIVGNGGDDTANGGAGNDTITTAAGNDTIDAGEGDDTVDASSGNDSVILGAGTDSVTIAADDLSSSDTITGGEGTDTLITSDTGTTDADFTNVTTMEVLTLNAATVGNFGSEFNESGIRTINGSSGVDSINFQNVTNDAHLTISGNDGADIIKGGSGNDTITGGEDADIITGSTGADSIDLTETIATVDQVVYDRAEDGAQTGLNTGFDVITKFVTGTDQITIDGSLEAALDGDVAGGNFNAAAATFTNEAALNAGTAGLAVYTNTTLGDSDLTQSNFTSVLNLLNTNLQTAASGDNVLYVVQSTNNTGLYFYQENGGNDIIDLPELKMLALIDSTGELANGNSLLVASDITDNTVTQAGSGGAVVVPPIVGTAVTIPVGAGNALSGDNTANETFTFDVAGALGTAADTQVTITDFDAANDKLQIDLITANAALVTLDQLTGVEGIAVQVSNINNQTLINFGNDTDGTVVAVTLAGIVDPSTIAIEVI
jgi:Ca2+-binding RTX toxin-like protein